MMPIIFQHFKAFSCEIIYAQEPTWSYPPKAPMTERPLMVAFNIVFVLITLLKEHFVSIKTQIKQRLQQLK